MCLPRDRRHTSKAFAPAGSGLSSLVTSGRVNELSIDTLRSHRSPSVSPNSKRGVNRKTRVTISDSASRSLPLGSKSLPARVRPVQRSQATSINTEDDREDLVQQRRVVTDSQRTRRPRVPLRRGKGNTLNTDRDVRGRHRGRTDQDEVRQHRRRPGEEMILRSIWCWLRHEPEYRYVSGHPNELWCPRCRMFRPFDWGN